MEETILHSERCQECQQEATGVYHVLTADGRRYGVLKAASGRSGHVVVVPLRSDALRRMAATMLNLADDLDGTTPLVFTPPAIPEAPDVDYPPKP